MRAVDVVGKRIVRVHQERLTDVDGELFWAVDAIELEDGTFVHFKAQDRQVLACAAVPTSEGGDRGAAV